MNIKKYYEYIIFIFGIFIFLVSIYFIVNSFILLNITSIVLSIFMVAVGFFIIMFSLMSLNHNKYINVENLNMFELNEKNLSVFKTDPNEIQINSGIDIFQNAYMNVE